MRSRLRAAATAGALLALVLTPLALTSEAAAATAPAPPASLTNQADWSATAIMTTTAGVTTVEHISSDVGGKRAVTVQVTNARGKTTTATSTLPVTGAAMPTLHTDLAATSASQATAALSGAEVPEADGTPDGGGFGSPSASGGITESVSTMDCDYSWCSDYIYNGSMQMCWGGGVPGAHWGRIYRCGTAWNSNSDPATDQWFSQLNWYMTAPAIHAQIAMLAWANMGYSPNTEFVFHTWANTSAIINGAVANSEPVIWITGFANGTGTWS